MASTTSDTGDTSSEQQQAQRKQKSASWTTYHHRIVNTTRCHPCVYVCACVCVVCVSGEPLLPGTTSQRSRTRLQLQIKIWPLSDKGSPLPSLNPCGTQCLANCLASMSCSFFSLFTFSLTHTHLLSRSLLLLNLTADRMDLGLGSLFLKKLVDSSWPVHYQRF